MEPVDKRKQAAQTRRTKEDFLRWLRKKKALKQQAAEDQSISPFGIAVEIDFVQGEVIMSKGKDSKKKSSNKPAKTIKEKKQAKKDKKEKKENPGILGS